MKTKAILFAGVYFLFLCQTALAQGGNWSKLGTFQSGMSSSGRIMDIKISPSNSNRIFAGGGGLFRSDDGGTTWSNGTSNADFLPMAYINEIAINPANESIMFVATGIDRLIVPLQPISGIYKSCDGGVHWNETLSPATLGGAIARSISISSLTPSNVLVGTSNGIYYSNDNGNTWQIAKTGGDFRKIIYQPNNANFAYAAELGKIWKGTFSGTTWTWTDITMTETPVLTIQGINLAFGASSGKMYTRIILPIENNSNGGYLWTYNTSTNVWTKITNAIPKTGNKGTADYTKNPLVIDPNNSQNIYAGGDIALMSYDEGLHWIPISDYAGEGSPGAPNGHAHADIKTLAIDKNNSSKVFLACDGGVFKSSNGGTSNSSLWTWTTANTGLDVKTPSYFSGTKHDANAIVIGNQDTGSDYFDGTSWSNIGSCDGGPCFIDSDGNVYYSQSCGSTLYRHDNPALVQTAFSSIPSPGPIAEDQGNTQLLYFTSGTQLYSSSDRGATYSSPIKDFSTFGSDVAAILKIYVAPSNSNVIYVITQALPYTNGGTVLPKYSKIFKTSNKGTNWVNVTPPPCSNCNIPDPGQYIQITALAIDPANSESIWISYGGQGTDLNYKVQYSSNGGTNWTSINQGLPGTLAVGDIQYEEGTNDAIYIATNKGVYYRNRDMNIWQLYNCNLPNVVATGLFISEAGNTITNALHGRGVWRSRLNCTATIADMTITSYNTFTNNWKSLLETNNRYRAINTITTSIPIPSSIVDKLIFMAGTKIKLSPGFSTAGKIFKAEIRNCDQSAVSCLNSTYAPVAGACTPSSNITLLPQISGPTCGNFSSVYGWTLTNTAAYGADLPNTTFEWFFNYPTDQTVQSTGTSMNINSSSYVIPGNPTLVYSALCRATTVGKTSTFSSTSYIQLSQGGCGSRFVDTLQTENKDSTILKVNTSFQSATTSSVVFQSNKHKNPIAIQTEEDAVATGDTTSEAQQLLQPNILEHAYIYPNPTTGKLSINKQESYELLISDVNGKKIYSKNKVNVGIYELDLTDNPTGSYFLKITDKSGSKDYKVIIDHNPVLYSQEFEPGHSPIENKKLKTKKKKSL